MEDSAAIWKTNPDNSWRLYTHTDYKVPETQPTAPKEIKDKQQSPTNPKSQSSSAFTFTKVKPPIKGSVTCTSKGYGVIHGSNEDKRTITVKIEGQVHELSQDEVLSDIPLTVVFLDNSMRREEVLYLPISSTMNEVIERAESSTGEGDNTSSICLFLKGKEVVGSADTLEKLKIMPGTKFLGIFKPKKPLTVNRFTQMLPGWSVGMGTVIAIAFSPSKTIRVTGFGMYKPQMGTLTGTAKFLKGSRTAGDTLYSENTAITQDAPKEIVEIRFNKAFTIKAGEWATATFVPTSLNLCNTSYGNGGKTICEGEGGVTFNFKACEDLGFSSNVDSGLLPEIYYYV